MPWVLTLPTPTSSHKFIPPKFVSYKALGALLRWEGRGFICQEHLWGIIFCSSPACAWPCHGCCPSPVLKYLFLWIPVEEIDSFYPLFQMAATREEDLGHLPKFPWKSLVEICTLVSSLTLFFMTIAPVLPGSASASLLSKQGQGASPAVTILS